MRTEEMEGNRGTSKEIRDWQPSIKEIARLKQSVSIQWTAGSENRMCDAGIL